MGEVGTVTAARTRGGDLADSFEGLLRRLVHVPHKVKVVAHLVAPAVAFNKLHGLDFMAKPINHGAKFPNGTFQTIHLAAERSHFMPYA
jgi:hypothetical protein